jgi:hypothetical protein
MKPSRTDFLKSSDTLDVLMDIKAEKEIKRIKEYLRKKKSCPRFNVKEIEYNDDGTIRV